MDEPEITCVFGRAYRRDVCELLTLHCVQCSCADTSRALFISLIHKLQIKAVSHTLVLKQIKNLDCFFKINTISMIINVQCKLYCVSSFIGVQLWKQNILCLANPISNGQTFTLCP